MAMADITGRRKFYDFSDANSEEVVTKSNEVIGESDKLNKYISENIIGNQTIFSSPYGRRKVVYCDYIASGRSLRFIEDYVQEQVLPNYGSTHTTSTVTALQTTVYRHEARDIIRNATRASEHDRVLFVGSGATGAINKLIHSLQLDIPPVVIVCPFTHHSSLLPWREIGAEVVRISEKSDGNINMEHLESVLQEYQHYEGKIIGCFAAASNVTGTLVDDVAITKLLHRYRALSFWDYATAAPYIDVQMNPICLDDSDNSSHKDAIFFSLHKFVGGVQTPGILIAKAALFSSTSPQECGGGTVFFVSRDSHRYLQDIEEREEGGTPAIVECIRGGLVMQLKMSLTPQFIMDRNKQLNRRLLNCVKNISEILPLGNLELENRLPVLSFVVRHQGTGRLLHHNYVAAVLNDLFGIQARGGCACAGPYAQDLLGIDESLAQTYESLLLEDSRLDRTHLRRREEHSQLELLRPGFVRLNLPYTASHNQIDFILKALEMTCKDGWKLMPQYIVNPETGEWKHRSNLVFKERRWLQNISYSGGVFSYRHNAKDEGCTMSEEEVIQEALNIFEQANKESEKIHIPTDSLLFKDKADKLRWFLLPSEAQTSLAGLSSKEQPAMPFCPVSYSLSHTVLANRPMFVWKRKKKIIRVVDAGSDDQATDIKDIIHTMQKELLNNTENIVSNGNNHNTDKDYTSLTPRKDNDNNSTVKNNEIICNDNLCFKKRIDEGDDNVNAVVKTMKRKWHSPPKNIFNITVEAIQQFEMIKDKDKVLVCLSGGKDSLSLLHTLKQYQYYAKSQGVNFSLGAITVDPQTATYDPRPLIPYLASLGVPYLFESQAILEQALALKDLNSICSFCSRMKRGRIYAAARREGYNVLAFGQHLDDLAESFIMSIFHNGRLRTMKASYSVKEGDLRVIRPFAFIREKDLREFAESRKLPIIPENCPACFEAPKERHRTKQMLAQQEILFPQLYWSLKTALLPLMSIKQTGIENAILGKNANLGALAIKEKNNDDDDEDCD